MVQYRMLSGVVEKRISKMGRKVKVQLFRGERIYDIHDYIKAPITKSTNNIILYIGANYSKSTGEK